MSTWRSRLFRYAAAGRPEHPVRQSEGGPARAALARIGGAPATGRTPGAARAVDRPRLRMDAPPTRSFPVSAAAAEGHAEGSGTAVSPLCGGAVRVPPAGGGSWRSRGTEEVAAAPRGAQGARRAVRGKGRFLVLPPGPARAGPGRSARPTGPLRMPRPGVLTAAGPARPPHRWNEPPQALPHVRNRPCPPCGESFARGYGTTRVARPPARRPPAPVLSAGMPRRTPRLS